MSDGPYRGNRPKLFNSNGFSVLLGEVAAVVEYSNSVYVHLKNGGRIELSWGGKNTAKVFFKTLSEAVEEYNR